MSQRKVPFPRPGSTNKISKVKLTDQSKNYKGKTAAEDLSDETDYSVSNYGISSKANKNGVNIISEVEMFDSEEEYRPDP